LLSPDSQLRSQAEFEMKKDTVGFLMSLLDEIPGLDDIQLFIFGAIMLRNELRKRPEELVLAQKTVDFMELTWEKVPTSSCYHTFCRLMGLLLARGLVHFLSTLQVQLVKLWGKTKEERRRQTREGRRGESRGCELTRSRVSRF
jgi:hypothetical protein